ncbi:pentatricopeptide repeat-containing protein At2g36730-like [Zingiber officinale]|uniref:pentatricopeptide repeat-containing protein At2g36730-like n=1 Tax=Zingiber officinale TaxID=94328 RepID=UPI001C4BD26F|nr:pentatricopeptide repeat-containing protein At2g36730-like [Zingiber officinale]XP_042376996.1 pentatricopeptide repeat-containing protein At2g36730-like [Zingiber officinale]
MLGSLSYGRWLHGRIPGSGLATNVQLGTAIVNMYAKCGALKCAGQVFDRMLLRNVWTWSAMILGLAQHGLARNAIELFDEMKHAFVELNYVTFLGVISACSHAGLVDVGLRLFHEMVEQHGIKLRMSHCSAMVYLLGRNGHLQEAYNFVQRMPIEPDAVVWRTLLSTCQLHPEKDETGIGQEAKRRLLELEPRRVGNYVMAVNMYSDQGSWDEAARVRRRMREEGLRKAPGESCIEVGGGMHRFISGDNYCNNGYETIITLIVIMVKEAMVRLQWSILPR